jgi:hypothetical protein
MSPRAFSFPLPQVPDGPSELTHEEWARGGEFIELGSTEITERRVTMLAIVKALSPLTKTLREFYVQSR